MSWISITAKLIATEIIRTVHKHSNMTTSHGDGGEGRGWVFRVEFGSRPNIFGLDSRIYTNTSVNEQFVFLR